MARKNSKSGKSFRSKTIDYLTATGMDANFAKVYYNRAYAKAARRIRKQGNPKRTINVSRELYFSFSARGNQLFNVDRSDPFSPSISIKQEYFTGTHDYNREFIYTRFSGMAKQYPQIQTMLNKFMNKKMSYNKLVENIEKFKKENQSYLKHAST